VTFFAASSTSTSTKDDVVGKKIIVKVQPKQTLSIVSKENGISVRDIVRLNGLGSRRTLRVGEELIVSDFEEGGGEGTFQIIERKEMTTTSEKEEEEEEEEKKEEKKESVASTSSSSSSSSSSTTTTTTTTEEKSQEQNAKNILRLVPENAKEAIMRKIERFKVETSKSAASTASKAAVVVQQSVTTSVPFTTSFGVGVGAAVLSMALVATNIGRGGERKDKEEEEKKETEVESSSGKSSDSDSSNASAPVVKQEEEKVEETAALAEKEATTVVEEKVVAPPPPPPPPVVEAVEEKKDVVEVARSQSQSPAPLERLKGWMDGERDVEENFESSIEEFKAKLAAAQDALIVLQDQLEQSKRNKKNNQK
jgi:murein DD-endopeptidase MepM/ murein hydrolase activator NlpD